MDSPGSALWPTWGHIFSVRTLELAAQGNLGMGIPRELNICAARYFIPSAVCPSVSLLSDNEPIYLATRIKRRRKASTPTELASSLFSSSDNRSEFCARHAEEAVCRDAAFKTLPLTGLGTEQAIEFVFRWTGSYSRMSMVLSLRRLMDAAGWLALLGYCWPNCDNMREYARDLRQILGTEGPLIPMMTRTLRNKLPRYPRFRSLGCIN